MKDLTQARCNAIARKLNSRPRERHGFQTPLERLDELLEKEPLDNNHEDPSTGPHPLLDRPPGGGGGKTIAPEKRYNKRRALSRSKRKASVRSTPVSVALRP